MAEVAQIYDIVNVTAEMVLGEKAITAVNTSTFVSLGEQLDELNMKDKFNNTLNDVIGRTQIATTRSTEDDNTDGMFVDGFTWGTILRKLYVDVGDATENPAFEIGKSDFKAEYAPIYKPDIKQYFFTKTGTYEYGVSIPDDLYDSAFHSETEMAVLISAILQALQNAFNRAIRNLKRLCRATYIANVLNSKDVRGVDLLNGTAGYNTVKGTTLSPEQAMLNDDFNIWSAMRISQFSNWLEDENAIYNLAGNIRRTPKDYQVLTLLSDYTTALKYMTKSNVFHEEFVTLPHYNEVNFWQGIGTAHSFKDVSTVSIEIDGKTAEGQATTTDLTYPYVIGILYDIEAMGVTISKQKDKSQYYPHEEYTNHWKKGQTGFFNDMSENAIVFYMSETKPVTPPSGT